MNPSELVGSGNLLVAIPIAMLAGLLSFASPCVLPLVPGYLGYIGGLVGEGERADRRRLFFGVLLFILGFAIVFVLYSAVFGSLGFWLLRWEGLITRILGVVVILMGLIFIGLIPFFQNIVKPQLDPAKGPIGALVLGIVFALGWTPCIGPVLTVITTMSFSSGSVVQGGILGFVYALGLGIPFLLIALGFGWATSAIGFLRRNVRVINIIGGVLLILIGLLMVSGLWSQLMSQLQAVMASYVPAL